MAEEVKEALGIDAEQKPVPYPHGTFDVYVNGELIFSKSETERLPDKGEIVTLIREKFPERYGSAGNASTIPE